MPFAQDLGFLQPRAFLMTFRLSRLLGRSLPVALAVLATLGTTASIAAPVLTPLAVDFEDLTVSGFSVRPGSGYQGFDWGDGFHVMCRENPLASCDINNYVATDTSGSRLISRTDDTAFYFDGGEFWSRRGLDAVGDFYFILYSGGAVVYRGDDKDLTGSGKEEKMLLSGTPTFRSPSYAGPITAMAFFFDNDDYDHFAFDNLAFRVLLEPAGPGDVGGPVDPGTPGNSVPTPASAPLLVLGLGLLAWRRRHGAQGGS